MNDLREAGIKGVEPEGTETGEWVLIDLFDIIVHIMQPEAREKYKLEDMWQITPEKKRKATKKPEAKNKPAAKKPARKKPVAKKPAAKKK